MDELAINGGHKTKHTPFQSGKRFDENELQELREALEQNTLFYAQGKKTRQFEESFARRYGVRRCIGVSSGTAGIHCALAALGVGPGDEVILPPITDFGSVIGILFQNAVPVFCDVDLHSYNITAENIERRISDRTRAVLAVHLAGTPCDMDPILTLARSKNIHVVEDCAQSYLAYYGGRLAGTFGDAGCFSLNDYKHISAGDAGMVLTDDEDLARRIRLFSDKGYDRTGGPRNPQALAGNYRMNELEAAVGLAQLKKLDWICTRRNQLGERLTAGINDLPGLSPPEVAPGSKSSFYIYVVRTDASVLGFDSATIAEALTAEGVPAWAGWIGDPAYEWDVLAKRNVYPNFNWPLDFPQYGRDATFEPCLNAEEILRTCINLRINEFFSDEDVDDMIRAVRKVVTYFAEGAARVV